MKNGTFINVGFFDLVCDASFAYFHSKAEGEHCEQNRFARASIISSALCIETFANCLVGTLKLPKRTFGEFDKLASLSKIDIFLKFSGHDLLDRGMPEVQKVSELIKARNAFVHVKKSRQHTTFTPTEPHSEQPGFDTLIQPKFHSNLGISEQATYWRAEDALLSLSAISLFIHLVMSRLNASHSDIVRRGLTSRFEMGPFSVPYISDIEKEIQRLANVGVDFMSLIDNIIVDSSESIESLNKRVSDMLSTVDVVKDMTKEIASGIVAAGLFPSNIPVTDTSNPTFPVIALKLAMLAYQNKLTHEEFGRVALDGTVLR